MFELKLFGGASIETPAGPLTGRATQRHRLALLALLALRRSGGMARDRLVAYLWPESSAERSRRLLADSVYRINHALGGVVIRAVGDEVRLDAARLPSDVARFETALERGELERAVKLYGGALLDGFFLPNALEFEHWVEMERDRFARAYAYAVETLAAAAEQRADLEDAVRWWRAAAAHDPYSSRVTLRLMRTLAAAGDRVAALRHARMFEVLLREDLGVEPDLEVTALAAALRAGPQRARPADHTLESPGVPPSSPGPGRAPIPSRAGGEVLDAVRGRSPPFRSVAWEPEPVEAIAERSAGSPGDPSSGVTPLVRSAPNAPTIAVLPFTDLSQDGDHGHFADGMTEELINTLSRVDGLRVASKTSVFTSRARGADVREIGARLGVATVLEGGVRCARDRLRITAQLVDTETGYHLWSDAFDREGTDVIAIQQEIARVIADVLKGRLVGASHE